MNCVGITPDGALRRLPAPMRLRLRCDEDAPADSLEARFPAWEGAGTLCGIQCFDAAGTAVFDGIVDEQSVSETEAGVLAELSARSRAALLLDNEAQPQVYYMPSLKLLFARHAAPYGFTGYLGQDEVFGGAYTVEKGMSEWQALEGFCKTFLGVRPVVRGRVLDASGAIQEGETIFSQTEGVPFTEQKVVWKDVCRLSELRMRTGEAAGYDAVLGDGEAAARGVTRRRFLSGSDAEQANSLLRQARKRAFSIRMCCPGALCPPLGRRARTEETENLYVAAWDYCLDSSGETCWVTLRKKEDG